MLVLSLCRTAARPPTSTSSWRGPRHGAAAQKRHRWPRMPQTAAAHEHCVVERAYPRTSRRRASVSARARSQPASGGAVRPRFGGSRRRARPRPGFWVSQHICVITSYLWHLRFWVYAGAWHDQELGWYWMSTRAYRPVLERFLQPGPSQQGGIVTYTCNISYPGENGDTAQTGVSQ